jgi:hypothetical protein
MQHRVFGGTACPSILKDFWEEFEITTVTTAEFGI